MRRPRARPRPSSGGVAALDTVTSAPAMLQWPATSEADEPAPTTTARPRGGEQPSRSRARPWHRPACADVECPPSGGCGGVPGRRRGVAAGGETEPSKRCCRAIATTPPGIESSRRPRRPMSSSSCRSHIGSRRGASCSSGHLPARNCYHRGKTQWRPVRRGGASSHRRGRPVVEARRAQGGGCFSPPTPHPLGGRAARQATAPNRKNSPPEKFVHPFTPPLAIPPQKEKPTNRFSRGRRAWCGCAASRARVGCVRSSSARWLMSRGTVPSRSMTKRRGAFSDPMPHLTPKRRTVLVRVDTAGSRSVLLENSCWLFFLPPCRR